MEPEWQLLCRITNSYAIVDEDEERFSHLITTMNREIDDLRKVLARKKGGSSDEDEDGGNDEGGSDDQGSGGDVTPVTPENPSNGGGSPSNDPDWNGDEN